MEERLFKRPGDLSGLFVGLSEKRKLLFFFFFGEFKCLHLVYLSLKKILYKLKRVLEFAWAIEIWCKFSCVLA